MPLSPMPLCLHTPQTLLNRYGIDELSDTDGEDPPETMTQEQIAHMLDRQVALTRELDVGGDEEISIAPSAISSLQT